MFTELMGCLRMRKNPAGIKELKFPVQPCTETGREGQKKWNSERLLHHPNTRVKSPDSRSGCLYWMDSFIENRIATTA